MAKKTDTFKTILTHKCPACGQGDIYDKLLEVSSKCKNCNLPLKEHDAGDGHIFFTMFIVAILVTILAFIFEIYFMIALWLHALLWLPLTILISIFLLKITKSWLITMQYRHNVGGFKDK